MRDVLLDLIQAFQARDRERIQSLLNQTAVYTGPHFRYKVQAILDARTRSLRAGLDLIQWAGQVRKRSVVVPE